MIEQLISTREHSAMSAVISVVITEVLLLASSGESPGMLLIFLQSLRSPRKKRMTWSNGLTPRMRNPAFEKSV